MMLAQEQPHAQWLDNLLATVPWIVIFLFLWFFIFRFMKREKHRRQELEAAKAQAAALQQQLNELSVANQATHRDR